ncbi:MAG: hypothetical protein IJB86_09430 [Clostridia bacterium]|nr:hypothetical protein [Clostridia bacterium]
MRYYIGVDGGGTKTYYALFDDDKKIIADYKTPGSNHENLEGSFDEAVDIIWSGITGLLESAGKSLSDISFTLMGLAGVDHPFQHDAIFERLEAKGLKNFEIYNDGFIVVKAGSISGAAIGLNNGTGTCCNSIDSDGTMLQLAGLGDYSGDMGNGHWIAMMAYRAIYDEVYLGLDKTAITKKYYDRFSLSTREEFLSTVSVFETDDAEEYIRALITAYFEALNEGDKVAEGIMEQMAKRSAALIVAHSNQLNFAGDEIEVVLSGSILTALPSDRYLNRISEIISEKSDRKFRFIKLSEPPVMGCVNWIKQAYVK